MPLTLLLMSVQVLPSREYIRRWPASSGASRVAFSVKPLATFTMKSVSVTDVSVLTSVTSVMLLLLMSPSPPACTLSVIEK